MKAPCAVWHYIQHEPIFCIKTSSFESGLTVSIMHMVFDFISLWITREWILIYFNFFVTPGDSLTIGKIQKVKPLVWYAPKPIEIFTSCHNNDRFPLIHFWETLTITVYEIGIVQFWLPILYLRLGIKNFPVRIHIDSQF